MEYDKVTVNMQCRSLQVYKSVIVPLLLCSLHCESSTRKPLSHRPTAPSSKLVSSCLPLNLHCLSKKVSNFKLSVTLSNLNRFAKFVHCWKAYEICYKIIQCYPPHLRHVAILPWEIKNSNFLHIFSRYGRKCKQIAF